MSWIPVSSKQIHSWKYDPIDQRLNVKFLCQRCKNSQACSSCQPCRGTGASSHYAYEQVPAHVWDKVRSAGSAGGAFNSLIKRGEHSDPPQPFYFRKVS